MGTNIGPLEAAMTIYLGYFKLLYFKQFCRRLGPSDFIQVSFLFQVSYPLGGTTGGCAGSLSTRKVWRHCFDSSPLGSRSDSSEMVPLEISVPSLRVVAD